MTDEQKRAARKANAERQAIRRAANPGVDRAAQAAYRKANPDQCRQWHRAWYEANRDKAKANADRWKRENPEKVKAGQRAYRERNKAKIAARLRAKKYGISSEEQARLLDAQGQNCAICRETFASAKDTHVDHDHTTGDVRGFLCSRCNQAIGLMKDSPARLRAAAAYLDSRQPNLRLVR